MAYPIKGKKYYPTINVTRHNALDLFLKKRLNIFFFYFIHLFIIMWRAIGWLLVFLFPIVMVYLTGGPSTEPLLDDHEYVRRKRIADAKKKKESEEQHTVTTTKKSKKNKKKKNVAPETTTTTTTAPTEGKKVQEKPVETKSKSKKNKAETQPVVAETKRAVKKQEAKKQELKKQEPKKQEQQPVKTVSVDEEPVVAPSKEVETLVKEIDEHMDPTADYARVLRIRPEEIEDEWESVPYEEGWSQVKSE